MEQVEKTLLAAVVASPEEDGPREAYARWVAAQDPALAEFITLQLGGQEADEAQRARREALRDAHEARWLSRLGVPVEDVRFVRGFPVSLTLPLTGKDPLAILERTPLRTLRPTTWNTSADNEQPAPTELEAAQRLVDPRVSRLQRLDLTAHGWGFEALQRLFDAPHWEQLRALYLPDEDSHLYAVEALVASPLLARLEELAFCGDYYGDLADEGVALLADSSHSAGLRSLSLLNVDIAEAGMRALARSPYLDKLEELDLGWGSYTPNHIGVQGAIALARNEGLPSLRSLVLDFNGIGDKGLRALAKSRRLGNLRQLSLKSNGIGDDGLDALAHASGLPAVEMLELTFNRAITADGIANLASAPGFARFKSLWLRQCPQIGNQGTAAIASSPYASQLEDLNLLECRIGAQGAHALATSPHLSNLKHLELSGNPIPEKNAAQLKERFANTVRIAYR